MTDENRKASIAAEWAQVQQNLGMVRLLLDSGFFGGAVGRAYFAVFHAAVCLLLTLGIEPRSHRGLIQLFNQHFVHPGRMPADFGLLLARMQKYREQADYDRFAVFTDRAARDELAKAEAFVAQVEALLTRDAWIAASSG